MRGPRQCTKSNDKYEKVKFLELIKIFRITKVTRFIASHENKQ